MYPVPKILWLREHQPEIFRRRPPIPRSSQLPPGPARIAGLRRLLPGLAFPCISTCDKKTGPAKFVPPLPPVRRSPARARSRRNRRRPPLLFYAASDLGLQPGTPVVLRRTRSTIGRAGHGRHRFRPGVRIARHLRMSAGSFRAAAINESAYAANLNTYCHVVPGRYVTLAYFPAGIMLDWFLHLLPGRKPRRKFLSIVSMLRWRRAHLPKRAVCSSPPPARYLQSRLRSEASGVISGLRPATSAAHIYKGILEGIACEFATMTELLQRVTGAFHDVYITGGGCRSSLRPAIARRHQRLPPASHERVGSRLSWHRHSGRSRRRQVPGILRSMSRSW